MFHAHWHVVGLFAGTAVRRQQQTDVSIAACLRHIHHSAHAQGLLALLCLQGLVIAQVHITLRHCILATQL